MVQILIVNGQTAFVADESITKIKGRGAIGPYTEVWGPGGPGPIQTAETDAALVSRLVLAKPLAVLHVPNGETVYIKGAAVGMIRPATAFEHGNPPPIINTIITVAGRYQALMEDYPTALGILNAAGANFLAGSHQFSLQGAQVEGLVAHHAAGGMTGEFHPW